MARSFDGAKSWLDIPPENHFPLNNIPFGVFKKPFQDSHCATRVGDHVIDLNVLANAGIFNNTQFLSNGACFREKKLNGFMALGRNAWKEARAILQALFTENSGDDRVFSNPQLKTAAVIPVGEVEMCVPAQIGDYTDFYSSIYHATNVGTMFRGKANALKENWLHLPVGYHGRASSIVVSGTPIRRPSGQLRPDPKKPPVDGACAKMDFEVEMAFFVGPGNKMGHRIPIEECHDHIFGCVLMNDWSARDIQKWEYVPLGPFNGKNFATTVSPWIVTMEALEPFKCAPHNQSEKLGHLPLKYLQDPDLHGYDINLSVSMQPKDAALETIGTTTARNLYWTFEQQLAHHSSTGCPFNAGDLCGSGTISGEKKGSFGSMLEISWAGKEPFQLKQGHKRSYIEDYDKIVMSGYCKNNDSFLGFGECTGVVLPVDHEE